MSLVTDKFFWEALRGNSIITDATSGRIFNPARPEIDEDEDLIPYIIISHDGSTNDIESKDVNCESDTDIDNISVLVVAESREELADLAQIVRDTIKDAATTMGEEEFAEMGFTLIDYDFSASGVQLDTAKPCCFQTLTYRCTTSEY